MSDWAIYSQIITNQGVQTFDIDKNHIISKKLVNMQLFQIVNQSQNSIINP